MAFNLVKRDGSPEDREEASRAFRQREIPSRLRHKVAAERYRPSDALAAAANVALAVGTPLLVTGEPGTGKTQVAHYLAWYLGAELYALEVTSATTRSDLLFTFDSVAYFHDAHDPKKKGKPLDRSTYGKLGPLGMAYEADRPGVVLIDEIDKAPRDFPNDLLHVLDQHEFKVPWRAEPVSPREGVRPPLVVITSNIERRLPEPFLRRCIFHHIELTRELVEMAVEAHFPRLDPTVRARALERLFELRARSLRKPPATAEVLLWLTLLEGSGDAKAKVLDAPLRRLPFLSALIKDKDDLSSLG
ncbi:AAA family ATPase [Sorangium cellulosum]|uniref:AAA family ATPase n=1 Tax=Sorangium cellulosum TaxID=56 RepID=A0A150R3L0_SORCE|nr:AAA family ATPase [Sorangium cellulosum]